MSTVLLSPQQHNFSPVESCSDFNVLRVIDRNDCKSTIYRHAATQQLYEHDIWRKDGKTFECLHAGLMDARQTANLYSFWGVASEHLPTQFRRFDPLPGTPATIHPNTDEEKTLLGETTDVKVHQYGLYSWVVSWLTTDKQVRETELFRRTKQGAGPLLSLKIVKSDGSFETSTVTDTKKSTELTGYKVVEYNSLPCIATLMMPADAHIVGNAGKFRADKAIVVAVNRCAVYKGSIILGEEVPYGTSCVWKEMAFAYPVGALVIPDSFDVDASRTCSNGIHFFLELYECMTYLRD